MSTTPSHTKVPRMREGKSILAAGKETRAALHTLTDFFERYLTNGRPPTGRNLADILELARKCAYLSRKPTTMRRSASDAAASANEDTEGDTTEEYDTHATYSMDTLDAQNIPTNFWPTGWIAFVFYGPYGRQIFGTDPLPILAENAKEQEALAVPRARRKLNEMQERLPHLNSQDRDQQNERAANKLILDKLLAQNGLNAELIHTTSYINMLKDELSLTSAEDTRRELRENIAAEMARMKQTMLALTSLREPIQHSSALTSLREPIQYGSSSNVQEHHDLSPLSPGSDIGSKNQEATSPLPSQVQAAKSVSDKQPSRTQKRVRRTKTEIQNGVTKEQAALVRFSLEESQVDQENSSQN